LQKQQARHRVLKLTSPLVSPEIRYLKPDLHCTYYP
jgi:hypothetical protein